MEKLGKAKNEPGAAAATGAPKRPVKEERAAAQGKLSWPIMGLLASRLAKRLKRLRETFPREPMQNS